jgi:hypothetical protein
VIVKKQKKSNAKDVIAWIVFITLCVSILFVTYRLIVMPSRIINETVETRSKSDYVLMLVQCMLGLVIFLLPNILMRKKLIFLPDSFLIAYFIFLYCAIYLGEVRNFYHIIPQWDTILHTFSGIMLGMFGFSVVMLLNDIEVANVNLSPLFIAIFAFCFASTLDVIWEIYEFTMDGLLGLNMQKFRMPDGTLLAGHEALRDTLKDLVVDLFGAAGVSVIGFIMMKKKPGWLNRFDIKRK